VDLRARAFAHRILACKEFDAHEATNANASRSKLKPVLRFAFELAYSRPPTDKELSAAKSFFKEQTVIYGEQPDAAARVWTDFCQMLLASNAFLYVD